MRKGLWICVCFSAGWRQIGDGEKDLEMATSIAGVTVSGRNDATVKWSDKEFDKKYMTCVCSEWRGEGREERGLISVRR